MQNLIVSAEVLSNASDRSWSAPLVADVESIHGSRPAMVLADVGYCNEADLGRMEALGVDGYVALGREGRRESAVHAEKLATAAGLVKYVDRK